MKAYLAIKYHADNANRDRIEGITAALAACGIRTLCIARDVEQWGAVHFDAHTLMQKSFDAIDACDLVVVDLTEKGVGIGIEAGYALRDAFPSSPLRRPARIFRRRCGGSAMRCGSMKRMAI